MKRVPKDTLAAHTQPKDCGYFKSCCEGVDAAHETSRVMTSQHSELPQRRWLASVTIERAK
eukprot:113155-Amphidinium_carterae.2